MPTCIYLTAYQKQMTQSNKVIVAVLLFHKAVIYCSKQLMLGQHPLLQFIPFIFLTEVTLVKPL